MPALDRNVKNTCENCDVQSTKLNLARHMKSCSADTLYCTPCPNFFTKSRDDLNYRFVKQHCTPRPSITFKCKLGHVEFPGFCAYTNTVNMEHKLDSEGAILMRRT